MTDQFFLLVPILEAWHPETIPLHLDRMKKMSESEEWSKRDPGVSERALRFLKEAQWHDGSLRGLDVEMSAEYRYVPRLRKMMEDLER